MSKLDVDQTLIRELADVLNDAGLTEIEIANGDHVIRIAKDPAPVIAAAAAAPMMAAAAPAAAPEIAAPAGYSADHPGAVTSPMVGTAYRSAEPTAASFVEIGAQVTEGDTLLIIEAMKTFNEIPAPCSGTVKVILFDNQSPVEFGDVLMVIE
jgi:acetyl-CoA carboxylase biotin carboxyl carrier protein